MILLISKKRLRALVRQEVDRALADVARNVAIGVRRPAATNQPGGKRSS